MFETLKLQKRYFSLRFRGKFFPFRIEIYISDHCVSLVAIDIKIRLKNGFGSIVLKLQYVPTRFVVEIM